MSAPENHSIGRRSRGRWRNARRRRGAAITEALVAVPFFAIAFVCMIFVGGVYREQLKVMREAKECVWAAAMANCEGGCSKATIKDDGDPDLDQGAEANPAMGAPGTAILTRGFKVATIKVTGQTVRMNGIFYVDQLITTPKTKHSVMCNEKPENGDWPGVFLYTYHKLTPW